MEFKVTKEQNNGSKCFICGIHNNHGLKTKYYEIEGNRVLGVFKGDDLHQSFPGRMHGGIVAALLDETIGRALQIDDPERWSVTFELTTKFLKPMPLEEELYVVGWIDQVRHHIYFGQGYICDQKGQVLATATGKYFEQNIREILVDKEDLGEEWIYVADEKMPLSFELPR
ncbi:MAG: PaaI family thioesterase [Acholeplasmataceae bacterium]